MKRFLLYISQDYAFEILRPLQTEIHKRGDEVAWFVEGNEVNLSLFKQAETRLRSIDEIKQFNPIAVYVPGNTVPDFIPGLKVQVFHGFEWKKKGHFRIRDCFDLYCTQGPLFTDKFNTLKQQHPHFNVTETGWPKIDNLMSSPPFQWEKQKNLPTVLYAPTFSPSLSSTKALFETIKTLSAKPNHQWLIKFHPKMNKDWVDRYKSIESEYLHIIESSNISPALQAANVLVSDTSSVITEFALLNKPIITFNNLLPDEHFINITKASQLISALDKALSGDTKLLKKIQSHVKIMHPYHDSRSSARVIDAALNVIEGRWSKLNKKPVNFIRSLTLRIKLKYWKLR